MGHGAAAVGVGQRLVAQRTSRGGGQPIDCVVVNVDQDSIWCVAIGLCLRPLPGEHVRINFDDGHVSQTGDTVIQYVRRTRRGFAFALLHPTDWDVTVYDSAVRIPVEFPAEVFSPEKLHHGTAKAIRAQVVALSLTGARVRSRSLLRDSQTLLLRFTIGGEFGRCTVLAQGIRAISGTGMSSRGYELDVRFIKMDDETRNAIRETVHKHADGVERDRQRQVELSANEWVDIQAELLSAVPEDQSGQPVEGLEDVDPNLLKELRKAS